MVGNIFLLILSIAIYMSYGIQNCIFIIFSILTTYIAAKNLKTKHRKLILIGTIAINSIILIGVKFLPVAQSIYPITKTWNIIVPVGISYYTLQIISYLVDVYKEKQLAETNFFYYFLHIMYIPHLLIGPITRYEDMKKQLLEKRKITLSNFYEGSLRIVWGLLKKLVISGRIAIVISTILKNEYNGFYALFAMILYSIELYSDFSGGIDIVLGVSKIVNISLPENFDSPYFSQSIKEFWRRWHITLSSWLKDYIYIPLGGNRCSKIRKAINVIITFAISGLWHGANYILWGILHGIFVLMGEKGKTKNKWINRVITFIIVSILWSFFIWQDTFVAIKMIGSVITNFNILEVFNNFLNLGLAFSDWIILFIFTLILFVWDGNKEKLQSKIKNMKLETKTILIGTILLIVIVFGIYGIGFNVNEFIYSKF